MPNHLSSIPTLSAFRRALSNIIYSCLLTLTVVQNLVGSNQLNVPHFVILYQLLPSHSPEIPCRPSKGVPSKCLRLVQRIISHRLHTGACVNLVLLTYFHKSPTGSSKFPCSCNLSVGQAIWSCYAIAPQASLAAGFFSHWIYNCHTYDQGLKVPTLSNSQHTCLIWLRLIFLHGLSDPPNKNLLSVPDIQS